MRGAKKDEPVSRLLFKNGILLDRRSFVSLNGNEPHLFLKGEDVVRQRNRVFARSRNRCAKCKKPITWESFEMHHRQAGLVGRHDDLSNLEAICHDCHARQHVQVQWTRRPIQEGMAEA